MSETLYSAINSAIFTGRVRHRRHTVTDHYFSYPMYMMGLDLDEVDQVAKRFRLFSNGRFNLLNFRRSDYLGDPKLPLKQAVTEKVNELSPQATAIDQVYMLGQVRCLGLYFSPVNFFFCYQDGKPKWMLAEVHNTPWNERHCYLVNIANPEHSKKEFHVSPFMSLDMHYRWRIKLQDQRILVHIENWNEQKLFDATLALKKNPLSQKVLLATLRQWPVMTFTILRGIYWQAIKLFGKRVPYYSHP